MQLCGQAEIGLGGMGQVSREGRRRLRLHSDGVGRGQDAGQAHFAEWWTLPEAGSTARNMVEWTSGKFKCCLCLSLHLVIELTVVGHTNSLRQRRERLHGTLFSPVLDAAHESYGSSSM